MKISGAIFDLDGTLLDSMYIWRNLVGEYLSIKGREREDAGNKLIYSYPLSKIGAPIKERYGLTESATTIQKEINEMLEEFYKTKVTAKEGVEVFLKSLKQEGISLYVATATGQPLAELALKVSGLSSYFEDVLSCQTLQKGKEYPDIYELALNKLGTKRQETIIFEDALYAVETAKKAGFTVAGIYDQYEVRQQEMKDAVDCFFDSYNEVCKSYRKGEFLW